MTDRHAAFAAELATLREAYLARLPQEIAELITLVADLVPSVPARERLVEVHQRLHKLAGSGGTFGLAALSHQAQALERTVQDWISVEGGTFDTAQQCNFAAAVAALANTLDQRPTTSGGAHQRASGGG